MYRNVFVAGTFDGIHKGHEVLLTQAFNEGEKIVIGLTPDDFVKKFKKSIIRNYTTRKKELEDWLQKHHLANRADIITIKDAHEPAASMATIDAIVVSEKTAFRGREINELRKKRNLKELAILEVPMVPAEDTKAISSSRLRNGEIDRDGRLVLPDNLRPELAKPLGRVLVDEDIMQSLNAHRSDTLITVGDVATETLIMHDVIPSLAIIDQKVGRKPHDTLSHLPALLLRSKRNVTSGPGYIAKEAIEAIVQWAKKPKTTLLFVKGEEDLLALPAIAHASQGSVVYYGQPEQALWACGPMAKSGLVEVVVENKKKQEVLALLERFT